MQPRQPVPKRVVLVVTPSTQALDVAALTDVFAMTAAKLRQAGRSDVSGYETTLVSVDSRSVLKSASGLRIVTDHPFWELAGEVDTLIVTGGTEAWSGSSCPALKPWLRSHAGKVRRLAGVAAGTYVLAEAGLLDGLRVTAHWYFCKHLQSQYPKITVDPQPIFIQQGRIITSGGVSSGIDLALAMVDEDFGPQIATMLARAFLVFLRRPGGQHQLSTSLGFQARAQGALREIPVYILEHLKEPLSVEQLAGSARMSVRTFSRNFARIYGETPAAFVQTLRLESALRLVQETNLGLEEIATSCGFGTVETARRAFLRRFSQTPSEFRSQATRAGCSHAKPRAKRSVPRRRAR